jgi:hypothetical protein
MLPPTPLGTFHPILQQIYFLIYPSFQAQYRYTNPMSQQNGTPVSPQAMDVYSQLNFTAPYNLVLTMKNAAG